MIPGYWPLYERMAQHTLFIVQHAYFSEMANRCAALPKEDLQQFLTSKIKLCENMITGFNQLPLDEQAVKVIFVTTWVIHVSQQKLLGLCE